MHDVPSSSFCLIVTDLCFVWLQRVEQKQIDADMKRFNPSIRKKTTNHTITMLSELLRENNAQQFHLVRLYPPTEETSHDSTSSTYNPTPTLQLESSMSLGGMITFKWTFKLHSYGGPMEQCAFLRAQMYLPLHEMIKILSYQVQVERRRYEKLLQESNSSGTGSTHSLHPSTAAAAAGGGTHHKYMNGHPGGPSSISLSLPSSGGSGHDTESVRDGGAGTANSHAAENFDAFANRFTFGQVGDVYKSALHRLSGEDGSIDITNSLDPFPSSLNPPSNPHHIDDYGDVAAVPVESSELDDRKRLPTAATRRRGVKRDRSPTPLPANVTAPSSTAAAAAAAAHPRDRAHVAPVDGDIDYKHSDDLPQPSLGAAGYDDSIWQNSGTVPAPSLQHASIHAGSSSLQSMDIGGGVDDDGVYHESEAERMRRELLNRQLSAQKKKKKKKAFV